MIYFDSTKYNSIKINNGSSTNKYISLPDTPSIPAEETYYEQQATMLLAKYGFASLTALEDFVTIPPGGTGLNPWPFLLATKTVREYAWLRARHPDWSKARCFVQAEWNVYSEVTHYTLDVLGLIPVLGEIPDLINGGIYLLEGNPVDAGLSFAATLPIGGQLATAGKWAKNALKAIDNAGTFQSVKGLLYKAKVYANGRDLHALAHVNDHLINNLEKGYHSVFTIPYNDLVGFLDDVYDKINLGQYVLKDPLTPGLNDRVSYIVNMGYQVGFEGGRRGSGASLTHVKIVFERGTTNGVVTAFPITYP